MARRYFGTDGVRGVYGRDLTDELVERLGVGFARWSGGSPVLVGRDTRASGAALALALARGLTAAGSRVTLGGVLPTPAVALLAPDGGAVVSASHNPPEYNGVKFFRDGWKLDDVEEEALEERMETPAGPGDEASEASGLSARYVELVCERFGSSLGGLRLVLDCANGAMYEAGPEAFRQLGAHVVVIGNEPDGANINVGCGAADLALLRGAVQAGECDFGLAFDGDGDRVLAVDADGEVVDGDQILAVLALALEVELVAVTVMTNLGFHRLMAEHGVRVVTTDVGDRYLLEALRREGGILGGEQSGHVLYLDGHTSGDGLAAGLLLAGVVARTGRPLAELASAMPRYPQATSNVPVRSKAIPDGLRREIEALAGDEARIVVRPSGTEPVVRVLAEAESERKATDLCGRIVSLVLRELG